MSLPICELLELRDEVDRIRVAECALDVGDHQSCGGKNQLGGFHALRSDTLALDDENVEFFTGRGLVAHVQEAIVTLALSKPLLRAFCLCFAIRATESNG